MCPMSTRNASILLLGYDVDKDKSNIIFPIAVISMLTVLRIIFKNYSNRAVVLLTVYET